jgi:integrase
MKKPTRRKPMRVGAVLLKEVPYKDQWRVEATWRDPERRKRWLANWRQAEEFAREQDQRLEAAKSKTDLTFDDASDAWIRWCEQRARAKDPDISLNTVHGYRISLAKAQARFGRMLLCEIESQHVRDWLDEQAQHYKRSSLFNHFLAVDQVLKFATQRKMLDVNPLTIDRVKIKGKRTKRVHIPDRSDMEMLRAYINGPRPYKHSRLTWSSTRVAIVLAGSCGLRSGEACGLRWDRIDPDTREIEVTDVVTSYPYTRVKPWPKTDAGFRRVPLTPRAQAILEEHAVIYKEVCGKCVGHVVRNDRLGEFIPGGRISPLFSAVMQEAGLVKEDGRPRFTFHALRHWCASHWMRSTGGDVHLVAKWLGHKHASVTLNTYGHCLDDAAGRERFLQMPDWLDPVIQIDGTTAPRPALPPPPNPLAEVNGDPAAVPDDCPIDVPDIAAPWLREYIKLLDRGMGSEAAAQTIHKAPRLIREELRRMKLPDVRELKRRLWRKKVMALYDQGYQDRDIARMVGGHEVMVGELRRELHKPNAYNTLKGKEIAGTGGQTTA